MTALLLSLAYLVGALPLGYWLARRRGVDLRTASPYTLGLESALRRLGLGLLLLSFLLDFLKGYLPLLLGRALGLDLAGLLALGVAVYLGHLYPLFFRDPWPLRAKGAGVLLGILSGLPLPPALGLVPVALGLVLYALTGYASLAALGLPLGLLGATLFGGFGLAERLSALALFLLALFSCLVVSFLRLRSFIRLRFFLRYRQHDRLTDDDRQLLRRVLALAAPMRDRQLKRIREARR